MFDRHAFLGHFGNVASTDPSFIYRPYLDDNESPIDDSTPTGATSLSSTDGAAIGGVDNASDATNISQMAQRKVSWFSDQVLPFDVTLAAANEYGALAIMRIYGCEILNEGYGVSIDDIVSEQQMSYVARTLMPWTSVARDMELIPD
jgi:hypothetical protein